MAFNEAKTRAVLIKPQLARADWNLSGSDESPFSKYSQILFVVLIERYDGEHRSAPTGDQGEWSNPRS
jgi:hypothetical protein